MKKKMLVVIGIAVCAILLTAPALASAGYSKIYGNANEDDTLDMRDVSYIKLAILGEKPATTLADANYDGKVSMQDVAQTKLIILGKEMQLTIVDLADRTVTVPRPIERLITRAPDDCRLVIAVGAGDKIVASEQAAKSCLCPTTFGEFDQGCLDCYYAILDGRMPDLPETSTRYTIDYELMASLHPDMIFTTDNAEDFENKVGVPTVVVGYGSTDFKYDGGLYEQIELIGVVLDREDEADELIDFIESEIDKVKSVTDAIDESEWPTVYFAPRGCSKGFYDPKEGRDFTRTLAWYEPLDIAGGMNVAKDEPTGNLNVGIEQIIAWDPEYIFIACSSPDMVDTIDIVRNAEDLQSIRAIQNDTVYNCFYPNCRGSPPDRSLFNMIYMAKLLHPDEFKDLDLEKEGNEIFEAFLGVDGVFTEYADWLVWPREYLDTQ